MADCKRGLGRPERAIAMAGAPEADRLDKAGRVELRIVAAGARRDLGQIDAAVVTLQCPELSSHGDEPWVPRLRYAYADALLAAGRDGEAREWFVKAAQADSTGATEADERLAELDGLVWVDTLDEDELDDEDADELDELEGDLLEGDVLEGDVLEGDVLEGDVLEGDVPVDGSAHAHRADAADLDADDDEDDLDDADDNEDADDDEDADRDDAHDRHDELVAQAAELDVSREEPETGEHTTQD